MTRPTGTYTPAAVLRLPVALLAAALLTLTLAFAVPASASTLPRTVEERIEVPAGPGQNGAIALDTTLYLPATTPAPAVLVAHGFGGTKASVDADARALVDRGFVVLAWTARGFGASGGQITLDSPDHEVADARALVDRLAARPEVVQDGPGDPRVGVTGGSYGGALALLLAGYDPRVDALAPVITWNDLGQALFPNAATAPGTLPADTPARGAFAPDGVFKRGWAGVFFSAGLAPGGGPRGAVEGATNPAEDAVSGPVPTTCGRFAPALCAAYTEAATTGRLSPATAELLRRSSPASVTDRITAPTLVVQGEADTLFGLDQADATARQIAAAGGTVRVLWYGGGHDGGAPDQRVRDAIGEWFDHWLDGDGDDPGTSFGYTVASGVRTGGDTPTSRTVEAPAYPGLAGTPAVSTQPLPLDGDPQVALVPPGGSPAAITSLPGLGGALGNVGNRVAAFTAELPGQSAVFRTAPVDAPLLVAGAPRVDLTVARVPGQAVPDETGPDEAVLFGKVYEVTADGTRTLLGGAVAPLRVRVPADGSAARISVTLPGVVAPIEAGNRLMVSVGTTDQGYTGTTTPAAWRIGVDGPGGALVVPVVPGEAVTANTVPLGPLLGIAGVLAAALLTTVAARLRRRAPTDSPDPAAGGPGGTAPRPLEIRDLAKTYRGGFSAVHDVSFDVERGMVLGLLGPNGAGKTTVLRMLMGLIRPTAGTIRAFGEPVGAGAPVLARIGAFVEGPGFLPHLSGLDNLRLYWAATGRPTEEAHLDDALEIAGLGGSVRRRVGTYSQGMRQRLAIAQAMLGLPELLVLDEPTNGLDPPQIHAMREVLQRYATAGRTVLVSSHLLAEVEQTCSHVVVMHQGTVVAGGTVDDIIAGGGAASFTVDVPTRAAEVLGGLDGVRAVAVDGDAVHAELNGTPRSSAVRALVDAGVEVRSAGPRRRLEDAFLQLVGEDQTR
jgi:ABC-2 type transport system ATP-binding protein